jgi:putative membrane protein
VRWGWLDRRWRFAEIRRLQALRLTSSPFDRRHGMATLWLDTAGASSAELTLRLPYLPEADARRLLGELGARLAATRLRW